MKLVHYSAHPVRKVLSVPRAMRGSRMRYRERGAGDKPHGFWVSDDDQPHNWREWCRGEGWGLRKLRFAQEITLSSRARILRINTVAKLDAFAKRYGAPMFKSEQMVKLSAFSLPDMSRYEYIDWTPVCRAYQGIVISPYFWSRRMGPMWYYSWGCASGVIWDADAIESVGPSQRTEVMERRAQEQRMRRSKALTKQRGR